MEANTSINADIAPDVYRISIYVPQADMQFNHFLVKDDKLLLLPIAFKPID